MEGAGEQGEGGRGDGEGMHTPVDDAAHPIAVGLAEGSDTEMCAKRGHLE